jgi:hypothetical protein
MTTLDQTNVDTTPQAPPRSAPWQLFFQQSNIVDKRITPRFIGYERADTALGAFVVVIAAAALMMTGDWAARATNSRGVSSMPARSHICSASTT